MKRVTIVALSLILMVVLGGCFGGTLVPDPPDDKLPDPPPDELPIIVADDFSDSTVDEPPANWRIVDRGSTDTPYVSDAQAHSKERSLRLAREPANSHIANGVVLDFDSLARQAVASFWFYATDPGRTLVITLSSSGQSANPFGASTGPFIVLRDSTVQAYSEGAFRDAGEFEIDTWHKVTIDVDIPSRTYNVFLDDAEEPSHPAPFRFRDDSNDNIAAFGLSYQAASQTGSHLPVYIDDVEIRGR